MRRLVQKSRIQSQVLNCQLALYASTALNVSSRTLLKFSVSREMSPIITHHPSPIIISLSDVDCAISETETLRARNVVDATRCFFFGGCMVASRGGYRMARGRHYAKLSLSNAARLSFSDLCILLFMFLSLCRLCVCVFLCSHWSLVDVPLIFFCPADHVPDWQPRVLLGMVEARSVNVKKTTTTTISYYFPRTRRLSPDSGAPYSLDQSISMLWKHDQQYFLLQ